MAYQVQCVLCEALDWIQDRFRFRLCCSTILKHELSRERQGLGGPKHKNEKRTENQAHIGPQKDTCELICNRGSPLNGSSLCTKFTRGLESPPCQPLTIHDSQIAPSGVVLHLTPIYGPVQEIRRQRKLVQQEASLREEARRAHAQSASVDGNDAILGQLRRGRRQTHRKICLQLIGSSKGGHSKLSILLGNIYT